MSSGKKLVFMGIGGIRIASLRTAVGRRAGIPQGRRRRRERQAAALGRPSRKVPISDKCAKVVARRRGVSWASGEFNGNGLGSTSRVTLFRVGLLENRTERKVEEASSLFSLDKQDACATSADRCQKSFRIYIVVSLQFHPKAPGRQGRDS